MMAFDPTQFEREQRERRREEHLNGNGHVLQLPTPLNFIDHADIDTDIPLRPFVVDKWVPLGCVTSLYGTGGTGKSFLAMLMGTCIAAGLPWLRYPCRQGNVLGLMCEDDDEELRRRRNKIARSLGIKRDQIEGRLFLAPRVGEINALMEFPGGIATRTQLFESIVSECRKIIPTLLILDNAAQLFAGNENDRAHVTAFLNAIAGIARECNCAVLLLGHPPKNTVATYSGSTGWDAVVRSRLWFKRTIDEDENEIEGHYTLELLKSNYARRFGIEYKKTLAVSSRTSAILSQSQRSRAVGQAKLTSC